MTHRIWVFAKQDQWPGQFWQQATEAWWITKSDGRPVSVRCEFPGGWTTKIKLTHLFTDTRNIIGKVPIQITPRMIELGFDEE